MINFNLEQIIYFVQKSFVTKNNSRMSDSDHIQ